MRNLCNSAAAQANSRLSDELDKAFLKVTSGAYTADEAVYSAVQDLGKSGIKVINYSSGHKDKVDVAVRRAVITGIGQAAGNMQLGLAADMGCDLVEVTAHLGARPSHAEWQGRIFSLSGKHPKYPEFRSSTGYGTGSGLCGWNCRHSFYPYFEGLSKPNGVPFTREENDKVYRDTQKQRAYERAIRQSKRELAALDGARSATNDEALKQKLDRDFQRKAVTLKRREAKLEEHLRNTGLLPDNSRVRVDGFGRSVSQKAVWAERKYNNISAAPTKGNVQTGGGLIKGLQNKSKDVIINEAKGKLSLLNKDKNGFAPLEYFESKEYKKKYKQLTKDPILQNLLYRAALKVITDNYGTMSETGIFIDKLFHKFSGTNQNNALNVDMTIPDALFDGQFVLVHNHPNNTPLSLGDIIALNEAPEISTIIAASHDGKVYWLQIGGGKRLGITGKMLAEGDAEARSIQNDWNRCVRDYGMLSALEKFISTYGWNGGVL